MTLIGIIVVAALVALLDHFVGIAEPWRKIILVALIVAFVIAVLAALGLLPSFGPIVIR